MNGYNLTDGFATPSHNGSSVNTQFSSSESTQKDVLRVWCTDLKVKWTSVDIYAIPNVKLLDMKQLDISFLSIFEMFENGK